MASSQCWKCLSRPSASYAISKAPSRIPFRAAFSTSSSLEATSKPPAVKTPVKPAAGKNQRTARTLKIKKKAYVKTGRPPAPGERKALRKRIVLSNTNALEVQGLADMTVESLVDPATIGKVVGIPGPVIDQLRAVEAFKTTQGWSLFRRPAMLMREESVEISKKLQASKDDKTTQITMLHGERGTGKSMMLLQAMATAFINEWVVISIPEARDLTSASTDYTPIPGTKPQQYSQNSYTAAWLGQILKANNTVLSKFEVTQKHNLPVPLQDSVTLARLAELGSRDSEIAWPFFQALWKELTVDGRPPIMLALDGLSNTMTDSAYRSPEFELIHAHDLAPIRHFIDYLSGSKKLTNGGAVIAATSKGHSPRSYALELAVQQKEEELAGKSVSKADPWTKLDVRSYDSLKAAELMNLKGLSKPEARGLMEYWAASGVLRQRVDEKTVAEKWALAGHGVVGEIERGALMMRI